MSSRHFTSTQNARLAAALDATGPRRTAVLCNARSTVAHAVLVIGGRRTNEHAAPLKRRTQCGQQVSIGRVHSLRSLVTCRSCLRELDRKGYQGEWIDRAFSPAPHGGKVDTRTWVSGEPVKAQQLRAVTQDRTDGRKVDVPIGATLQLQLRSCGKRTCRKCGGLQRVHGPYWYAYWRETTPGKFGGLVKDRLRTRYIGRQLFASMRARSRALVTQDAGVGVLESRELFEEGGDE